ncbi:MAG: xylulokinase [Rhodanobacter sp.]
MPPSRSMFIGIDLGTSSVKAILLDRSQTVRASASVPLAISNPHPGWSEQDPEAWWQATVAAMDELRRQILALGDDIEIGGIGLSGQMHGAVLLDAEDHVLRPAILWNDGRCIEECRELEQLENFRAITGNLAMPGFTAPKLMWVRRHEPAIFARVAKVLLPKDYLRFKLTGVFAGDMSDAAGTLWLNVGERAWSEPMLAACGLTHTQMPELFEGNQITGHLHGELARRWGMGDVPVAAGGGDNAAGAVGVGIIEPGQAMLSLGTSGVFFAVSDAVVARPEQAVHSFCHALPDRWHVMSVMLSAASCLDFTARLADYADVPSLLADAEAHASITGTSPWFLPYLSGERTPHNDRDARGAFIGLSTDTPRAALANATLEGVGLGLLDGLRALESAGIEIDGEHPISVIGGGSRSAYWMQMLADILGRPLQQCVGGDVGPALGAARLAWLAVEPGQTWAAVCPAPPVIRTFLPDPERHRFFCEDRFPLFRRFYRQLRPLFADAAKRASIPP